MDVINATPEKILHETAIRGEPPITKEQLLEQNIESKEEGQTVYSNESIDNYASSKELQEAQNIYNERVKQDEVRQPDQGLLEIPVFTMPELPDKKKCGFLKENGKACRRKIDQTEVLCSECLQSPKAIAEGLAPIPQEMKAKYEKATAAKCLFMLQFSAYIAIEKMSGVMGVDLSGLPQDLKEQRDDFMDIFERMYEEYGPEYIDKIIGPVSMWALLSINQIGTRYTANITKKN